MFTVIATSPIGAAKGLGPYDVQDALRRAIQFRDEGYRNIKLRDERTGVTVDIEEFMRGRPDA